MDYQANGNYAEVSVNGKKKLVHADRFGRISSSELTVPEVELFDNAEQNKPAEDLEPDGVFTAHAHIQSTESPGIVCTMDETAMQIWRAFQAGKRIRVMIDELEDFVEQFSSAYIEITTIVTKQVESWDEWGFAMAGSAPVPQLNEIWTVVGNFGADDDDAVNVLITSMGVSD